MPSGQTISIRQNGSDPPTIVATFFDTGRARPDRRLLGAHRLGQRHQTAPTRSRRASSCRTGRTSSILAPTGTIDRLPRGGELHDPGGAVRLQRWRHGVLRISPVIVADADAARAGTPQPTVIPTPIQGQPFRHPGLDPDRARWTFTDANPLAHAAGLHGDDRLGRRHAAVGRLAHPDGRRRRPPRRCSPSRATTPTPTRARVRATRSPSTSRTTAAQSLTLTHNVSRHPLDDHRHAADLQRGRGPAGDQRGGRDVHRQRHPRPDQQLLGLDQLERRTRAPTTNCGPDRAARRQRSSRCWGASPTATRRKGRSTSS